MNILSILKKKYRKEIEQRKEGIRQRRQLNMMVDERLINRTKELAAQFTVPRYCLVEHLLETGCFYLNQAMEKEDEVKMLREHLINVHLIDSGIDDSEAILRIGEGGNISHLLTQVSAVRSSWEAYKYAITRAQKTGNTHDIAEFEKCERRLMKSVIAFALWVEHNRLDESGNSDIKSKRGKADSSS